ncbi:MAG TPA: SEL1-like repeat protein, partial [Archangium sp.]
EGCYILGLLYAQGRGVEKDERRAAALYEKACEGGEASACGALGALNEGVGVEKDERRDSVQEDMQ